MEPRNAIIHAALVKHAAGEDFSLGKLLDNPVVGYGLAGAGIGAGASLYQLLKHRPDQRKGALRRLLMAMATGGGIGAAGALGMRAMGVGLPSVRELPHALTVEPESSPNDAARSIGVGALGAGTLYGASLAKDVQLRNKAFRDALSNPQSLEKLVEPHVGKMPSKGQGAPGSPQERFRLQARHIQNLIANNGMPSANNRINKIIERARARGEGGIAGAWDEVLRSAGKDTAEAAAKTNFLASLRRNPAMLGMAGLGVGSAHYLMNRE